MIFLEEGGEWRLPGLLYVGDLVLCGELEEGLKEGHKGENFLLSIISFLKICFFYCSSFHDMIRVDLAVVGGGNK